VRTSLSIITGSTSSAFSLVTISGCAPYAAVDVRRPSFPGCRLASLEQSATSRHVCTVTAYFLQSSEDSSLQPQFLLTILLCLRSDTRHYGHINRCSYLLTYLQYTIQYGTVVIIFSFIIQTTVIAHIFLLKGTASKREQKINQR